MSFKSRLNKIEGAASQVLSEGAALNARLKRSKSHAEEAAALRGMTDRELETLIVFLGGSILPNEKLQKLSDEELNRIVDGEEWPLKPLCVSNPD